jgi:hypothetical protein
MAVLQEVAAEASARGEERVVTITTDVDPELGTSAGGVVLTAFGGKIRCCNTLEERLSMCLVDLTPVVRDLLFPSARAGGRQFAATTALASSPSSFPLLSPHVDDARHICLAPVHLLPAFCRGARETAGQPQPARTQRALNPRPPAASCFRPCTAEADRQCCGRCCCGPFCFLSMPETHIAEQCPCVFL